MMDSSFKYGAIVQRKVKLLGVEYKGTGEEHISQDDLEKVPFRNLQAMLESGVLKAAPKLKETSSGVKKKKKVTVKKKRVKVSAEA